MTHKAADHRTQTTNTHYPIQTRQPMRDVWRRCHMRVSYTRKWSTWKRTNVPGGGITGSTTSPSWSTTRAMEASTIEEPSRNTRLPSVASKASSKATISMAGAAPNGCDTVRTYDGLSGCAGTTRSKSDARQQHAKQRCNARSLTGQCKLHKDLRAHCWRLARSPHGRHGVWASKCRRKRDVRGPVRGILVDRDDGDEHGGAARTMMQMWL